MKTEKVFKIFSEFIKPLLTVLGSQNVKRNEIQEFVSRGNDHTVGLAAKSGS